MLNDSQVTKLPSSPSFSYSLPLPVPLSGHLPICLACHASPLSFPLSSSPSLCLGLQPSLPLPIPLCHSLFLCPAFHPSLSLPIALSGPLSIFYFFPSLCPSVLPSVYFPSPLFTSSAPHSSDWLPITVSGSPSSCLSLSHSPACCPSASFTIPLLPLHTSLSLSFSLSTSPVFYFFFHPSLLLPIPLSASASLSFPFHLSIHLPILLFRSLPLCPISILFFHSLSLCLSPCPSVCLPIPLSTSFFFLSIPLSLHPSSSPFSCQAPSPSFPLFILLSTFTSLFFSPAVSRSPAFSFFLHPSVKLSIPLFLSSAPPPFVWLLAPLCT
ncbi:uncharacterized protein LOC112963651 [Apteryx rowi]|uniref:uncharacterized protein LOC112963651 n=1 Tax=Apteryx rowi TaxID=308060 RepID=UPI000E1C496E|nr:uncharacterized protein LOC112963651 [Apteryx rowi]